MKKSKKKRQVMNLKDSLLILSLFITLVEYFYLFFFSNIELSSGFWAIIFWIIVVVVGGTIYTLGIKSVIKRDDLPKKSKEQYVNVEKSRNFSTYLTYVIILGNIPCWYIQQTSLVVYLPIVILGLAACPWDKLLKSKAKRQ